jgi:hypothetical protein
MPQNSWFPSVETEAGAKTAARQGVGAAIFVACVTGLFAILAIFNIRIIANFSPWALVDAGLFGIAGWRIYRMSRIWAVVAMLGFLVEKVYALYTSGGTASAGLIVAVFILFGFINGVRGTFAHYKLSASQNQVPVIG